MVGQGRPNPRRSRFAPSLASLAAALLAALAALSGRRAVAAEPTMTLRIEWGYGGERRWHGSIALDKGALVMVRTLGIVADAPGSIWADSNQSLAVNERSPRANDGVDLEIYAPLDAKLTVNLTADGEQRAGGGDVLLADLISKPLHRDLDGHGSQLLVRRSPGDLLRVNTGRDPLIFLPGEAWKLEVRPWLLSSAPGTTVSLKAHLYAARSTTELWSQEQSFQAPAANVPATPLSFGVPLPAPEGVYDVALEATERTALRWTKTVAERRVQVVVLGERAPPLPTETPAWTQVLEIDPDNPRWFDRWKSKIPGVSPASLDSGGTQILDQPLGRLAQLAPTGRGSEPNWQAYPLAVSKPGTPHMLEIQYPADAPQTLGISIIEPNAAGTVGPIQLHSGVYLPDELATATPRMAKQRMVFWPRTTTPVLLLTDRRESARATYGKIRLLAGPSRLWRAFPATARPPERLLAGYFDRPLVTTNFSATEALDPISGRSLMDWQTFFDGGNRLVDYLNSVGYNGAMLAVASEGSTIYPSRLLQPTPRYDTGAFFDDGQDPQRKDVLELMLRLFDREQMKLIPTVQFSTPLPDLEALIRAGGPAAVGIQMVGADGVAWTDANPTRHGLAPYYNPLDERVQQSMLAVVRELMGRYGTHPSLYGLAIELSADGFAQLPGVAWGLDDRTFGRFLAAAQLASPESSDPQRHFAERAEFVAGPARRQWLDWRATVLSGFYHQVRSELAVVRPDARLYLVPTNMLDVPELQHDLRPGLPSLGHIGEALAAVGIQPEAYVDDPAIVLLRPQRLFPPGPLAQRGVEMELARSAEWDRLIAQTSCPGSLLYHDSPRIRLSSFDARSPLGKEKTFTWMVSQFSPSQEWTRQRFVHSLATLDSQAIFDGGWQLPLGQEESLIDLVAAYRQLPAAKFTTLPNCPQPITIRTCPLAGQTCLYLVNDSAWAAHVDVHLNLPPGAAPLELGSHHRAALNNGVWSVDLAPFDLAVFQAADNLQLFAPQVELDPAAQRTLQAALGDLRARLAAVANPAPVAGPANGNFAAPLRGTQIPGWATAGAGVATLDIVNPHGGRQALKLVGAGGLVTLRSDPFPAGDTGRLAVSFWLRVPDPTRQPQLRVALESTAESRPYFRSALLGAGAGMDPIPSQWKQYIFSVDDVPTDGVAQLRFRIDLNGPSSEVSIDDVQLFDLLFSEAEKIHLNKIPALAEFQLSNGQLGDCLEQLNGYWPRLLAARVPMAAAPIVNVPARAAPAAAAPAQATPAAKTGVVDRIRSIWKF